MCENHEKLSFCNTCGEIKKAEEFNVLKSGKLKRRCKRCEVVFKKEIKAHRNVPCFSNIFDTDKGKSKLCKECSRVLTLNHFHKQGTLNKKLEPLYCTTCKECERKTVNIKRDNLRKLGQYPKLPQLEVFLPLEKLKCKRCCKIKDVESFSISRCNSTGRHHYCRGCQSKISKAAYDRKKAGISLRERYKPIVIYEKVCTVCKALKSTKEFAKCRRNKDGYHGICNSCHNIKYPRGIRKGSSYTSEAVTEAYVLKLLKEKGFTKPTREMIDIQIMTVLLRREARKQLKEEANANN